MKNVFKDFNEEVNERNDEKKTFGGKKANPTNQPKPPRPYIQLNQNHSESQI